MRSHESDTRVEVADAEALNLELADRYFRDYLAVFIRDPQNPQEYWYNRLGFMSSRVSDNGRERVVSCRVYNVGESDHSSYSEEHVTTAIGHAIFDEQNISNHPNAEIRGAAATVGIARYEGHKQLSMNQIISIVALGYLKLKGARFS